MPDDAILAKLPGLFPRETPEGRLVVEQELDLGDLGLDADEVKAIVQGELDAALGQDGGTLSQERMEAIKYYMGEPLGTEVPGRSSVVMRSVLEAVEWVLPALLRIFTASSQIAVVEPRLPDQEEQAKTATDYLNFIFYRDNPGFMILHDWFKDALLEKVGWVRVSFDSAEESVTKSYTHISQEQFDALMDQDGTELLKKRSYKEQLPRPPIGPPGPGLGTGAMPPGPMPGPGLGPQPGPAPMPPPPPGPPGGPPPIPGGPGPRPMMPPGPMMDPAAMSLAAAMAMMPPPPVSVTFIDCTIKTTQPRERVIIENCPPEEILVGRNAKRGSIPFLAHRTQRSYSDLVRDGYDPDALDLVPMDDTPDSNSERVARRTAEQDFPPYERTGPAKLIWVEECYVYLAGEDDEVTDLYRVTTAGKGKVILTRDGEPDIEPVPEIPYYSLCPIPMPHKLYGLSLADLTMDIQLIKSTLIRQCLDNGYLSNFPRIEVGDDVTNENTYEDLVNLRPGGIIRTRRIGGIGPITVPYTADKTFPLVEYFDQQQEIRTGVARQNQGLNPDDLNRTASGISMLQQAAAQRCELYARIFAIGLQEMLTQVLNLCRRHQQQKRIIKVTGKFIQVDPTQWVDEMPVTVSVGLGTGNKDQLLQYLMQVLGVQQQIVQQQGGLSGPLVYGKNVFDVLSHLTESAGFKTPFFSDPTKPPDPAMMGPPQPEKPDPAAQALQAKAMAQVQAVQAKAQAEVQLAQMKAQIQADLDQRQAASDIQIAQIQASNKLQVEAAQARADMQVAQLKAENEMAVEKMKAEQQAEIAAMEVRLKFAAGAFTPGPAPAEKGEV